MKHYGDITKINGADVPIVDIVCGGSPCQDLSVAGKRAGLDGERSGLFMEQIRIIKEMRNECIRQLSMRRSAFDIRCVRPRYMVWENVPGAFSSNKGEDFRCVLEETARIADKDAVVPRLEGGAKWTPSGAIMGDGWSIAWRVHDAQFWGVPQRRKRICLLADFNGDSAGKVLFELRREAAGRDSEQTVADTGASSRSEVQSVAEGLFGNTAESRAAGQGSAGDVEGGFGETGEVSYTLNAVEQHGVCQPIMIEMTSTKNTITEDGISPTLTARMGTGGNQVNSVFARQRSDQLEESEVVSTQSARQYKDATDLVVGSFYPQMKAESQCWREDNVSNTLVNGTNPGYQNGICSSIVRRLTPLECERLQGFPGGWTDIGEWIDSKGKKHKDADSPRYKALGNSIALPFWEWMAARMVKYLEKPTMASLFDGIGGFPLVFSRCGCEPIWASEIEEFPIAVTKIRFSEKGVKHEEKITERDHFETFANKEDRNNRKAGV